MVSAFRVWGFGGSVLSRWFQGCSRVSSVLVLQQLIRCKASQCYGLGFCMCFLEACKEVSF